MTERKSGGEEFLDELFNLLRNAPWWVGLVVIGIAYALQAWAGPFFLTNVIDRSTPRILPPIGRESPVPTHLPVGPCAPQ